MTITIDSYELVADKETPDGVITYYIVTGKIDNLPFRKGIEPHSLAEVAGKWDEATAIDSLKPSSADILETATFVLKTEGLVRLNPTTHEIEFALPTTIDKTMTAMEKRLATLENTVAALEKKP